MIRRLPALLLLFMVVGCDSDDERQKLEQYIAQVKTRPSGEIEVYHKLNPMKHLHTLL